MMMTTTTTTTMSTDDLRVRLETTPATSLSASDSTTLLVLDCRPFLAYNEAHVRTAVNAYCPSILRRRAAGRGGKLPFHVLIPSAEVRDAIRCGRYSTVVLYDENGAAATTMATSTTAAVVADDQSAVRVASRCLLSMQRQDLDDARLTAVAQRLSVFYLDGGFQKFRRENPHLCVGSSSSSSSQGTSGSPLHRHHGHHQDQEEPAQCNNNNNNNNNPVYEQGDPVEILPHLYLGSAFHAANVATLDRLGVTALLNVSRSRPAIADAAQDAIVRFAYKSIPIDDSNSVDISSWFNEAIQFIDDVRDMGGKVLVHCHAGISRSATICLAYLMFTQRIRLEQAYEYVKTRRSVISPNFNFMGQLLKFEAQLMPTMSSSSPEVASSSSSSSSSHRKRSCAHQPKFVFDMGVSEDRGYSSSSVVSSSSTSPTTSMLMCSSTSAPAIMSPS